MGIVLVLVNFGLMGLNLSVGNGRQKNGENYGFNYFVAGVCFMSGLYGLIKLAA